MEPHGERRPKTAVACNYCRLKKIKCNGGHPCPNCIDHGGECVYPGTHRKTGRTDAKDLKALRERLSRVEALLPSPGAPGPIPQQESGQDAQQPLPQFSEITVPPPQQIHTESLLAATTPASPPAVDTENPPNPVFIPGPRTGIYEPPQPPQSLPALPRHSPALPSPSMNPYPVVEHPPTPSRTIATTPGDDDGSCFFPPEEETNYEYHGPGSFLSICSKSGIEWVNEKTGVTSFTAMARKLTFDICRRLKLEPDLYHRREPEPEPELAWRYIQAYFEDSYEVVLGLVCRPAFESRLRAHFKQNTPSNPEQDPSWYALRNAVYATGCRTFLAAEQPSPFLIGQGYGWQYFQNALSVQTALLYSRTNLMSVQALAVMSYYVEGIGAPALDYMLCSSAMKLAESKGLHRQPAASWNLSGSAIQTRSYTWWAIYGYERLIAYRSGRPLSIDDNEITCNYPSEILEGSMVNLDVLVNTIKHAQISGQITKRITALKASNPTVEEIEKLGCDDLPTNAHPVHLTYQAYAYYGSLMAIHSILVHPWNAPAVRIEPSQKQEFRKHVTHSTNVIVEASRKMIQHLRHINIDASSPKWLVFTFPLTAFVNLFVHVLQHPALPSVDSDIELMYTVSGHFSYLEFASPDMAFPFTREVANLARHTAAKVKSKRKKCDLDMAGQTVSTSPLSSKVNPTGLALMDTSTGMNTMDLDNERWCTLLSWPDSDMMPFTDAMFDNTGPSEFDAYS